MFYNVLDANASLTAITSFTKPDIINVVSLHGLHKERIGPNWRSDDKLENYLLVSQDGAITPFHQDASGTSVIYIQMKGCKTFYIIIATPNNQELFDSWFKQSKRDRFFGSHVGLDAGGCKKVVLREGSTLLMPANVIHMVETTGTSISYGINFIHRSHLIPAAKAYAKERENGEKYAECFPYFPLAAVTHMLALKRYV